VTGNLFTEDLKGRKARDAQLNRHNKKYRAIPSTAPHASYPL